MNFRNGRLLEAMEDTAQLSNESKVLDKISVKKLYSWQRSCLFFAVLLFPLQTLLFYNKSLISIFSFYGQVSSLPVLMGLILAVATIVREKTVKRYLVPFLIFACCYGLLIAVISIHSIVQYASVSLLDAKTFGETPKILLVKSILLSFGVSSDSMLYALLVFIRDMLAGVKEIVFVFGFVLWIAFLYLKDGRRTFETVRKAIFCDIALLAPYFLLEIFHLYGAENATMVLRWINSYLYEPCSFLGWYPPLVSPNQVRGTWTEPAYFAIWCAFITPFLISYFEEQNISSISKILGTTLFFAFFWCSWLLTWSRTSAVMIVAILAFYLLFAFISHRCGRWKMLGFLVLTLSLAFVLVSSHPPSERGHRATTQITESVFVQDVLKSTIDPKSRSNPTRLQGFLLSLRTFMDSPILGFGDTLSSVALIRRVDEIKDISAELLQRKEFTQTRGIFQSAIGGGSMLSVGGLLVCRGLLGAIIIFLPIISLGLSLFSFILKERSFLREEGVFISCSVVLLSAFSQGLWLFYFWCSCGLALGMVLTNRLKGKA